MYYLWEVVQPLWARKPSSAKSNSWEGCCCVPPVANTPGIWGNGCLSPEEQPGPCTPASTIAHHLHAQIHCLQILSPSHLGIGHEEFWLAYFQGKLTRGSLEDESQPLHCCWSQGHVDTRHFFPQLPTLRPQHFCRSKWLILWGNPDSHPWGVWIPDYHVLLGLWLLHLTFKIGQEITKRHPSRHLVRGKYSLSAGQDLWTWWAWSCEDGRCGLPKYATGTPTSTPWFQSHVFYSWQTVLEKCPLQTDTSVLLLKISWVQQLMASAVTDRNTGFHAHMPTAVPSLLQSGFFGSRNLVQVPRYYMWFHTGRPNIL